MRIAYLVSRFPNASETFILRELDGVATGDFDVELLSLFAPKQRFVHPKAERWVERLRRPSATAAAASSIYWLVRSPVVLTSVFKRVAWAYRRSPRHLIRALATVPLAAGHARTVKSLSIEHIHAHFATYPALAAWVCARLTGVSYSFTAHAHDLFVDSSMLSELVGDAAFVATISEFNRSFIAERLPGSKTPVHLVRCGVQPDSYNFRRRRISKTGPVRALCVASLEEYKGHEVLLKALAMTDPQIDRLELQLIGAGSLEQSLRGLTTALGLQRRVTFLGLRTEDQVAEALAAADLFVLPSIVARDGQMEGIPVALMEALASGVPTVATRLSGIPELVRDGETGRLAKPGDPQDMARALRATLAERKATYAALGAGRRLVEQEFNIDRSVEQMRTLIAGVASKPEA